MSDKRFEEHLPRTRHAPGIARRAVVGWFGMALSDAELETARLLTSELVANAVVHGEGAITLRGHDDADRVLVEVVDQGKGFAREVRQHEFGDLHGRGLAIVDAEASRWGIHEGTTHVWFELERSGPRLGSEAKPAP